MIKDALNTLNKIRDIKLEECCMIFGSDDVFTEYNNHDWEWATESAEDEFINNFDDYNNWIFEDDYETKEEWEIAKYQFKLTVVKEWR